MASSKVILVTGGNSGIGYETVKALLQSDKAYHILLGARSSEKAKLAIETLHKECSNVTNTVESIQIDLTSDESIETAFKQVKANPGRLDILVNNAGKYASMHLPFQCSHQTQVMLLTQHHHQAQPWTSNSWKAT